MTNSSTIACCDDRTEQYLEREAHLQVDFESENALAKLARYGLAGQDGQACWCAVALLIACERLDARWDNFFRYNRTLLALDNSDNAKSQT